MTETPGIETTPDGTLSSAWLRFRLAVAQAVAPEVQIALEAEQALLRMTALGLTSDEQRQALDAAARLAAVGALHRPAAFQAVLRVLASGRMTAADLAALEVNG